MTRRDNLVHLMRAARGFSIDMAPVGMAFQQVTLAAVDVTAGLTTYADVCAAAEACLRDLDMMIEAEPIRRTLRTLLDELGGEGPATDFATVSTDNFDNGALAAASHHPPRKSPDA